MPDLESELAAQLHRQAASLRIDDQMRDRLVRRVRAHQRRRRAVLASAPLAAVAAAALATALIVPSAGHPSPGQEHAAPANHGFARAAAPGQASSSSPPATMRGLALPPGGGGDLRWVDFVSPTRGWALAEVEGRTWVARTTDGGMRWVVAGAALPTGAGGRVPTRLVVAPAGIGSGAHAVDLYAYSGTGSPGSRGAPRLDVSVDRGSSWQVVALPGVLAGVAAPPWPGGSAGRPSASDAALWALVRPSGVGGAGPGRLEVSTDAGRTWRDVGAIPGTGNAEQVTRVSQRAGFVVSVGTAGDHLGSALFETADGGASWQRRTDPCGSLPDQQLSAVDADHLLLACGGEPAQSRPAMSVYVSADAGRTWGPPFALPSGTGGAGQVTFVDATHGWVLAARGLWRTSDGVRWERLGG